MKALLPLTLASFILVTTATRAQSDTSDIEQITATLMDYIEGTANGEPERLRKAFHPD
ncbi:MAG: nuclear transport factor 2 family protein, partial [Flavobacteriales bacterium]|nr:nuclear transport factor 2 family protein [Flavobacteriales bacterium]